MAMDVDIEAVSGFESEDDDIMCSDDQTKTKQRHCWCPSSHTLIARFLFYRYSLWPKRHLHYNAVHCPVQEVR